MVCGWILVDHTSNRESAACDVKVKEGKDANAASPNVIVVVDAEAMSADEACKRHKDK